MKLLGLRLCAHDSNISYFDGNTVKYLKTERIFQHKHHFVGALNVWDQIIKKIWGVNINDLDEICIVLDPWKYGFDASLDNFFPSKPFIDFGLKCKVTRLNHHYAHHLSCWPLIKDPKNYNGITIDGYGDWDKAWTIFKDKKIYEEGSTYKHGSIGQWMADIGKESFKMKGHGLDIAGKLMSLQSYGKVDTQFLNYLKQFDLYDVHHIFSIARYTHKIITPKDLNNWLRTVHEHVGLVLLNFFKKIFSKEEIFLYTGGVALNVTWNTLLKKHFKNIIIPPHTNDDGLSLGALEFLRIKHNLPHFKLNNFPFCQTDESPQKSPNQALIEKTVDLLKKQKIIGWYQGHGEIGPRALGNRSILADPRDKEMRHKVNKIKKREQFRPFGCSTIEDEFSNSEYMLLAETLKTKKYPAIKHIDNTCRHQKVNFNGPFLQLLNEFKNITDCGTLLNTSLNVDGKPLASYKRDALSILKNSELDGLVYGNQLYLKEN